MKKTSGTSTAKATRPLGIAYLIGRLDHALSRRMRDSLAPIGFTLSQYTALAFLDTRGQMSNAQLAEFSLISPQSANEMVKMMEARGWIERQPDRSHGRIIQIRVTETGKELLRKCDAAVARIESSMLADLSNEEFAALQEGMRSSLRALTVMNAGL